MTATLVAPTPTLAPAPKAPAPAPALPGGRILAPAEQIARRPLPAWAAELAADLRGALAEDGLIERARRVTGAGNTAALVLTHMGRLDDAERIVRAQIAWLHAGADRTGEGGLAALALQPWVNLGRLHALHGRADRALAHYHDVRACRADRPWPLAGRVVEPAHWAAAGWETDSLDRFGRAVLVMDGLRVLVPAARWDDVLALADGDVAAGTERLGVYLREARLIALGRRGELDAALAEAGAFVREAGAWDRVVATLRRAELLALAGEDAEAARIVAELVAVCGRLSVEGLQLAPLFVVQALVALALARWPSRDAFALGERLVAAARKHDDEVMELEVLRPLVAHARPGAGRDVYAAEARRLSDATGYARLRPRDCPPEPSAAVDALLERTLAALVFEG